MQIMFHDSFIGDFVIIVISASSSSLLQTSEDVFWKTLMPIIKS